MGASYPRELETERLHLSAWTRDDGEALAQLNADPEVMRFLRPADRAESLAQSERFAAHWDEHGFGLWALRRRADGDLIGFAGLSIPFHFPAVLPAVEAGWRLRRDAWGHGYATEAGRVSLRHGFTDLGLGEIVSLVHEGNVRSRAVAGRLGLRIRERIGVVVVYATGATPG
ncbi:MAG TPA: GNAT family N-acetyltransferase [Solirubrobacteraceae bacterium]